MSAPARPRVGVCGLGLVGGSLLLGLRAAGLDVRGCDNEAPARRAFDDRGMQVDASPEACARAVDVLVVCVPPEVTAPVVAAALDAAPDVVVLDAASVKAPVAAEVARRAGAAAARFVPAHPLAGGEVAGHAAADPELLRGATWAVCPPPVAGADVGPLLRAAVALDALDARLLPCTPEAHDRAVGATSHAVHVLAGVVAAGALRTADDDAGLTAALSGGALRDATRVAAAPFALWRSILDANRDASAEALQAWADALADAARRLRADGPDALRAGWEAGAAARERILAERWAAPTWTAFEASATWEALLALGTDGGRVRRLRGDEPATVVGERAVGGSTPGDAAAR